jgi:hypothetical protein
MEYTGIQNSDVATLSLLDRGYRSANFEQDGSVLNAKADRNAELSDRETQRLVDNQKQGFDAINNTQQAIADVAHEFRVSDRFANLTDLLYNQLNQIDRRFAAQQLQTQECCCKLEAEIAKQSAKLDAQEQVRQAIVTANNSTKLDQLLSRRGNG